MVGGLDRPDSGSVRVAGTELVGLGEKELLDLRRDHIGFVFQSFGLLPVLTAAENVGVPLRLRKTERGEREDRVALLLSLVGLEDHAAQRPGELSGGQQQRVAIARALANRPSLLLADEPTGQLDAETGRSVMELLRAVVHSQSVTALVATRPPAPGHSRPCPGAAGRPHRPDGVNSAAAHAGRSRRRSAPRRNRSLLKPVPGAPLNRSSLSASSRWCRCACETFCPGEACRRPHVCSSARTGSRARTRLVSGRRSGSG